MLVFITEFVDSNTESVVLCHRGLLSCDFSFVLLVTVTLTIINVILKSFWSENLSNEMNDFKMDATDSFTVNYLQCK